MDPMTVKQLAQLPEEPSVSILFPLDTHRPGNLEDPGALTALRDRAVAQVRELLHRDAAASLVARIDDALESVDLQHPSPGVAVLVSPSVSRILTLDNPVPAHVVVGGRFAIRDLMAATSRTRRARIIVLAQDTTRCIDLTGDGLVERRDFGFPIDTVAPTEADTPHGDFPLDEHEHAEAVKFVFRAVDRALHDLEQHDPRPLVIVGPERDLAYFDEVAEPRPHIVATVRGNHERDTPQVLAQLVQPVLEEHERNEERLACAEVREGIGAHATSGITDVWAAARDGRGRRLVVEDGYSVPARIVAGALETAPDDEPAALDAVAETVVEVLRHDGAVMIVPAGSLSDLGHIALLTRY